MATKKKATKSKWKPKTERQKREGYHLPVRSEQEQFEGLSEELYDVWLKLREFLIDLGPQEPLRTSHRSIMFSRKTCYAFVRPKRNGVELNFFLLEALDSDLLHKVESVSKTKWVHVVKLTHADQVIEPITDWLQKAYELSA